MDPLTVQNHLRTLTMPSVEGMPEVLRINGTEKSEGLDFGKILADSIKSVNDVQNNADIAIEKLVTGQGGSIHETLLAMQKAELSMRMLVEVRGKVMNAYQEMMRMQI